LRKNAPTDGERDSPEADRFTAALFAEFARLRRLAAPERELRRAGALVLAGTDEVGRGCLAGPVVAAAVILQEGAAWPGVDDSKKLEPSERAALAAFLKSRAVAWAVVSIGAREIDEIGIATASLKAMKEALETLRPEPDAALTDAFAVPGYRRPQFPLIKGDARSISIAAASIVAKAARDEMMVLLARRYPAYGFEIHKGYGVSRHREILARIGPSPEHRLSFRGVVSAGKAA
jgi:ribonuclease HII